MRSASIVLALCGAAAAQQQILDQIKGLYNKATGNVASAYQAVPNPVDAAASAIAAQNMAILTTGNFRELFAPGAATSSPGVEEWFVYVTGGNKTCLGKCEHSEKSWNKSVPIIAATRGAPNLALLDCEKQGPLCYAWNANPPSAMHLRIPQPAADQSRPKVDVRHLNWNITSVTANELAAMVQPEEYLKRDVYEGWFHPFNGPAAEFGLNIAMGYVVYFFNIVPSWAVMIGVSMVSRTMLSRRATPPPRRPGAPGGAAPAPAT